MFPSLLFLTHNEIYKFSRQELPLFHRPRQIAEYHCDIEELLAHIHICEHTIHPLPRLLHLNIIEPCTFVFHEIIICPDMGLQICMPQFSSSFPCPLHLLLSEYLHHKQHLN